MKSIQTKIIGILKHELEYREEDYCQWVFGASVRKEIELEETVYTVRTVVKTDSSPFVDGMDIIFTESGEEVMIEYDFYENGPDFHGGEEKDAVIWLGQHGELIYLQRSNPYQMDIYMERLKDILGEYFFEDLMEYGLDGEKKDLAVLCQDLIQETLLERVWIDGESVGDGKFRLKVIVRNKPYMLDLKSEHTRGDIIDEIIDKVLMPLMAEE